MTKPLHTSGQSCESSKLNLSAFLNRPFGVKSSGVSLIGHPIVLIITDLLLLKHPFSLAVALKKSLYSTKTSFTTKLVVKKTPYPRSAIFQYSFHLSLASLELYLHACLRQIPHPTHKLQYLSHDAPHKVYLVCNNHLWYVLEFF